MSVTVLAPTPALPPVRRQSMWEKIFGNFMKGKRQDRKTASARPVPDSARVSKARLASISTGVETAQITYKRNSVAMAKESRSSSAPLPQSHSPSRSRAASIASIKTRRSSRSSRRSSWWRSANPEVDEEVPAVPSIDRKYSIFGSHNPDVEPEAEVESDPSSETPSRRLSYVPRNAASSFLKTTTPLSTDEKADVIRRASVVDTKSDVNRRASMADMRSISAKSSLKTRRPSNLVLNSNTNTSDDSTADHGMFSMAGVCEIEEPCESNIVSRRAGSLSVASAPRSPLSVVSAPRSPTDTIMEVDVEIIDSAKNSPDLLPVKPVSHIAVVELVA